MRAAYRAGNVREARALARAVGAEHEEARALLRASDIDPRALAIGGGALALGLFYLLVFILLR